MAKRVIKFRNTNDFARVERRSPRPKQPSYTWNGKAWVLSQPSQKFTVDAGDGILWTSCAAGGGGGSIGQGTKMQTAFGAPRRKRDLQMLGDGIGIMGLGMSASLFLAPIGVPIFAVGVMFNLAAGSIKNVTFSRPCHTSSALQTNFEEPTFTEFQQQYAAYLAGRNNDQQNVNPLEMQ